MLDIKKIIVFIVGIWLITYSDADVNDISIFPEFLKPGEDLTIYFQMKYSAETGNPPDEGLEFAAVFSKDSIWDNNDLLIVYNGGEGIDPVNGITNQIAQQYPNSALYQGWNDYPWNTKVPTTFMHGEKWYIIVRVNHQKGAWWGQGLPAADQVASMPFEKELAIQFEVAVNKDIIYNTAYVNDKSATAKFVISKGLPGAYLEASPSDGIGNTYVYSKQSINVALITNTDPGAKIYYTLDNSDPMTNGIEYTDSITIVGDDTLKAVAIVPGYENSTGIWYYDQQLPSAKLIADPSNDSVYTYTSQFLNVKLETNTGNKIVYQLISATDTTAWDTTADSSKVVQISGDVTISAFTIGSNFNSVSGSWVYECELPELKVVADPSDTSFEMNLSILLSAINSDTLVDALIKFIIDSTGTGFQASEVKANGTIYNPADSVKISKSVTIYVSAVDTNGNYSDGLEVLLTHWNY